MLKYFSLSVYVSVYVCVNKYSYKITSYICKLYIYIEYEGNIVAIGMK